MSLGFLPVGSKAKLTLDALSRSLAVIEFTPTGHILSPNQNFCKAMGYEASEIIGRHHSIFVSPDYAASKEYKQFWDRVRAGSFDEREFMRIAKGGREVWIRASYNPVTTPGGKLIKVVKVATDITSHKQKSLEDAARLEAISRSQAIIEFTPDGKILYANENFLNTVGYTLA